VVVARVTRNIRAYVVPNDSISYTLLLCRGWLMSINAIGIYKNDAYFIKDRELNE